MANIARAASAFNLGPLRRLTAGAGSMYARVMLFDRPVTPLTRGIMAREQVRALREEGVIKENEKREGIASVSMIATGLGDMQSAAMSNSTITKLFDRAVNLFPVDLPMNPLQITTDDFLYPPAIVDRVHLDDNRELSLDPTKFLGWVTLIRSKNTDYLVAENKPSAPPAKASVSKGEIHPWMFGGISDLNIKDGTEYTGEPIPEARFYKELALILGLESPSGSARRAEILRTVAQGLSIVTSGGNMTSGRARRVSQQVSRETMVDIDISVEVVKHGWDFLSLHWGGLGIQAGAYRDTFDVLGQDIKGISLRLSIMCDQTEMRMLTGINVVAQSLASFSNFPWNELAALIEKTIGRSERAVIERFLQTLAERENHWIGWGYALRTIVQGGNTIPNFANMMYCALQLQIQVGGNRSLREYRGLENVTIPLKPVIDAWIQEYEKQHAAADSTYPTGVQEAEDLVKLARDALAAGGRAP